MSDEQRPDPDALLARVKEEEARARRGRLKIFLGAAPGVGKTYAMLAAAQARRAEGVDVVVGLAETHGRAETERLTEGLESLPRRRVRYREAELSELDLDAALARRPQLILVDELAHTNAPESRHAKRWQDVEELLAAGIDVYTTLNVQHLESLNDVVAQITGVVVRETIPDDALDRADDIEVVDVTPEVLLERLREGKVYVPDRAARAVERFFRKGNLMALREMALRRTAQRVDEQMRGYMAASGIRATWPASERVLVCVGPNPATSRVLRAGRRIAVGLKAEWFAIYVETPAHQRLPRDEQEAVTTNLQLAERLGARVVRVTGLNAADEVLAWARTNNVTRIVVGKPTHPRWRDRLRGSLLDALVRGSGAMEVDVVTGEGERAPLEAPPPVRSPFADYVRAGLVVGLATVVSFAIRPWVLALNIGMVFLLAVVYVATRVERGPTLFACLVSIAVFDFCFVPPYYTFRVEDGAFIPAFGIMLGIALLMSGLTARVRDQGQAARARERRTAALYALSRELAATQDVAALAGTAVRQIRETFGGGATVLLPDQERLVPAATSGTLPLDERERAVARWVFDRGQAAGHGTATLPGARARWTPLTASGRRVGVLGVVPADPGRFRDPAQRQLLDAFADQTAVALDRALLARETQQARLDVEAERLRGTLLSSLSHDLRTPLGAIEGAATTLLDAPDAISPARREELLHAIVEQSHRMTGLVANLLEMVRVESGMVRVNKEWQPLEEVVGIALLRTEPQLAGRAVTSYLPGDLPLIPIDGLLIEQVLVNLLENAARYTPAGTAIDVGAELEDDAVVVEVADRGPGIPRGDEERIFQKFARLGAAPGGAGLGLAICRGIVTAHGGRIWVEPRPGGGARFRFTLPIDGHPPSVTEAEETPAEPVGERA